MLSQNTVEHRLTLYLAKKISAQPEDYNGTVLYIMHIIKSWMFNNHQNKETESQILICLPGAELKVCLLSNMDTMQPHFELKEQRGRPGCLQVFGWPFCMVNIAQSLLGCLLGKKIYWLTALGNCVVLRHENKLSKKKSKNNAWNWRPHYTFSVIYMHTQKRIKFLSGRHACKVTAEATALCHQLVVRFCPTKMGFLLWE